MSKYPVLKILLTCILVLNSLVASARDWSDDEKLWAVASTVVTVADWATTRDLTRRYNQGYYEHNPILGKHPSTGRVDAYFGITIPVVLLIANELDEYRKPWLMSITAIEAVMVGNNLHIGLKMQF